MLQLYIDDKPAVIQSGTTFKFTRENPAFSELGDYTFEVTLPLAGCVENQRIFNPVHRAEVPMRHLLTDKKFYLISPLITMKGSVRVQSITDEEVKVQLVAGRSEANINTKDADGNDIYIDELDLGTVFDEYDISEELADISQHRLSEPYYDGYGKEWTMDKIESVRDLGDYLFYTGNDYHRQHGSWKQTSCTFFPVVRNSKDDPNNGTPTNNTHVIGIVSKIDPYNKETETYVSLDNNREDYRLEPFRMRPYNANITGVPYPYCDIPAISPQPRLYECLRRILKAVGFTLKEHSDQFLRSVIVVHSNIAVRYVDMLPHWTLSEFLKEFNNFFASVIVFNLDGTAEIRWREDFYSGTTNEIEEVEDTLETEFEEESAENNSATGNVDYDWPDEDGFIRLPDDVWESVEVIHFDNYSEVEAYYKNLSAYKKQQSDFLLIDDSTSFAYASIQTLDKAATWQLTRVDYYPPLINDSSKRDITTELKIVPCRVIHGGTYVGQYTTLPLLSPSGNYGRKSYSVNTAINSESTLENSESDNEDKSDYIEVAYPRGEFITAESSEFQGITINEAGGRTPHTYPAQSCPIALGVMITKNENTGMPEFLSFSDKTSTPSREEGPFILTDMTQMRVAQSNELELITSRIEHQFKFIAKSPIDITCTFLIRGRRYVCHKLEYSIHPDYVDPLVTGYFYELNE